MRAVRVVTGRALPLDRANVDTDQIIPAHWLKRVERTGYGAGLFEAWRRDPAFVMNDPRYAGASILIAGPNFGSGSSREHAVWALDESGFRAVISPRLAEIFRANCLKSGVVPVEIEAEAVAKLLRLVQSEPRAEILLAGANFGSGSSREHAVWALEDAGFRAVIAPSFADIFRNNCAKVGLVTAQLPEAAVLRLMRAVERDPALELELDIERREVRALGEAHPFPLDDFTRMRLLEGLDDVGLTLRHEGDIAAYERARPAHLPAILSTGARSGPAEPGRAREHR